MIPDGFFSGGEARPFRQALARFFEDRRVVTVSVPVLQPADPYLDTAGEDFRRRIFLTRGESGEDLCLRPDFTIPVCLAHIAGGEGLPRRYGYDGVVFRQRRGAAPEFRQAGIEDLGDADAAGADARALADALAGLLACGVDTSALAIVLGDQALFEAFLGGLALPEGWRRRLVRAFGHDDLLAGSLKALSRAGAGAVAGIPEDLHALARDGDAGRLRAAVSQRLEEGGLPPNRGRSAAEIAERLIEKVAVAESRLGAGVLAALTRFLALDCAVNEAARRLDDVCAASGVDLGSAISLFERRNRALEGAGVDLSRIRYRAGFGRPLDYYTGMVFEIAAPSGTEPLAAGGRYDRLVSYLGARQPIPAVGFSLWLDRIAAHAGEAS